MKFFAVFLLILQLFVTNSYVQAFESNDEYFDSQWYLEHINVPEAWDLTFGNNYVTVAVIDTGIDIYHEDINFWKNNSEIAGDGIDNDNNGYIDDVRGWDFQNNDNDPTPDDNLDVDDPDIIHHGTIVSGIIAGIPNNNVGIAGISWKAEIMPLKIVDSKGTTSTTTINKAIYYAVDNGAQLINISLVSTDNTRDPDFDKAIQYAFDNDVLIVAAAGNGNVNIAPNGFDLNENPAYPVCSVGKDGSKITLGVGGSNRFDNKASFSNYGEKCISVSAPAVEIVSTLYKNESIGLVDSYGGSWYGTSFAAPIVTGTAAYLLSIDNTLKPSEIITHLINSGDGFLLSDEKYLDQLGTRINVEKAVKSLLANDTALTGNEDVVDTLINEKPPVQEFTIVLDENNPVRFTVSPENSGEPKVSIFNSDGKKQKSFQAYNKWDTSGVDVKMYFSDKDLSTYFVAPKVGYKPMIRLYNEGGILLNEFLAYSENFKGGVNIAIGNLDNKLGKELVVAPSSMGGPHIRIFNEAGELKGQFFAHDADYRGGLSVATGDVTGDGIDEIIIGLGKGEIPIVKVFSLSGELLMEKIVYGENFRGGVNVASADLDGDGVDDIITGPREGGGAHVRIFSGKNFGLINQFFAYDHDYRGGLNIDTVDFNRDGLSDILVTSQTDSKNPLKIFTTYGDILKEIDFSEYYDGGILVNAYR